MATILSSVQPQEPFLYDTNLAVDLAPFSKKRFYDYMNAGKIRFHKIQNKRVYVPSELKEDLYAIAGIGVDK